MCSRRVELVEPSAPMSTKVDWLATTFSLPWRVSISFLCLCSTLIHSLFVLAFAPSEDTRLNISFTATTELNHRLEDVFEWHQRPGALERLCAPWMSVSVVSRSVPFSLIDGQVRLRLQLFGPLFIHLDAKHCPSEFVGTGSSTPTPPSDSTLSLTFCH